MIKITPCDNKIKTQEFLNNAYSFLQISEGSDQVLFIAEENNNIIGLVALDIKDYYLRILNIDIRIPDNDDSILDLLIRSSASYALNRKIFVMQCLDKPFFEKLKKLNFYEANNSLFIEIYKLPKSCDKRSCYIE